MNFKQIQVVTVTSLFLIGASAHAVPEKEDLNGYLGGLLGISSANENVGTGLGFGINGGYFAFDYVGLGAFLRAANHSGTPSPSTFAWGGEVLFRFVDLLPGLHLGAQLGSMKLSTGNLSNTGFMYGFKAAYDVPLSEAYPITVGVDLSANFASIGNTTLSTFNPMVAGKFWF